MEEVIEGVTITKGGEPSPGTVSGKEILELKEKFQSMFGPDIKIKQVNLPRKK